MPTNSNPIEKSRYNIALDIEKKSSKEKQSHVNVMIAAKNLLYYGGYLSDEEANEIQRKIDKVIRENNLEMDTEAINKIRIIQLPFE